MSTYILYDTDGGIAMCCSQPFDGCSSVDFDVVTGHDGKLYKAGEEPAPLLVEVQAAKRVEINAGFETAITGSLTMPSASAPPSAFAVYQAIEVWKAEDPEGYSTLLAIHEARRASLLAAVDAATTIAEVQAISVTYAV